MPRLSPQQFAEKWARKFGASGEAYKEGVQRVQGNPAEKAIAAKDRLVANFVASVNDGKWEAGLRRTTEQSWKAACVEKGAPALATAARVATEKVARAEAAMGSIRDGIVASLPPRGTIEENMERARLMAMGLHNARKRG